jgi:dTDP-4-dehydrorhamnose 3,5-epimerase-like enzyme
MLRLIELPTIGSSQLGYISIVESNVHSPFVIKRVYWTYFTPNDVQRGGHAHKELEQLIFAVNGSIEFATEDAQGTKEKFILTKPHVGLYIPKLVWRDIRFSHSAVLLCLASDVYQEDDYIRDYNEYLKFRADL